MIARVLLDLFPWAIAAGTVGVMLAARKRNDERMADVIESARKAWSSAADAKSRLHEFEAKLGDAERARIRSAENTVEIGAQLDMLTLRCRRVLETRNLSRNELVRQLREIFGRG